MKKISQLACMFANITAVSFFSSYKIAKRMEMFLLISFFITCFTSCSTQQSKKKFTVGFAQCTMQDVWRQNMLVEMKRELSFHPEIELIVKDADLNPEKQIKQIQEFIDQKVDLLIAVPAEAKPTTPIIDKAYKKGIPVILVDRNTMSDNYTAYIGANNYKVGQVAGMYAKSLLKDSGNVIEISGIDTGSSADIGRHTGFTGFIKQYPGIKYIERLSQDWDNNPVISEKELTEKLKALTNIQLIFAQNDRIGYGAYKVCKKLGIEKRINIIGVDGLPGKDGGIDLVEKGFLKATILYPTGGKEAIATAANILNKKPYDKENELVTTIIDPSNVTIMKMQNQKVIAQQEDIDKRQKIIEEQIAVTKNQTNIILTISVTLALALISGAVLFYYLQENKKINKKLEQQKEEISSQRNQLIELSKKAQAANDAKVNFFTNISHELRTPLTLILGPLEETLSNSKLHFSAKTQLEMVKKNSMRLLRLVNQLMDFRKIEENKMKLNASENNITDFVTEITNAFTELAHKKKISFRTDSKDQAMKVWFDVNMLDKVLFNLLSNAFKYTDENGSITVTICKDETGKNALLKIEDSGIGMNAQTTEHAFDIFYQGHEGTYKGTGLGLALSKELIMLHHGSIKLKSEKGKGTIFEILLPLGKDHLEADEILVETAAYHLNYEDAKIYADDASAFKTIIPEELITESKEQSILVIEDNTEIRDFIKTQLSKNYEIIEADNGNTGLNLAYEIVPDVIVSDIMLPGKDGMVITETLKNDIRTSHIPIVILTAKNSIEQQIEGLKHNADAYIVKPFNMQYLEETIKSLLRNREVLKVHYTSGLPNELLRNSSTKKIDRKFVNEFSSIVENNIANEDFSVNDICKELGISRVQLYRKVKAVLGYNVNDYILEARMQRAKYLLMNESTLSISEISYKVGFSSQAYFSTVFKSKFGVTPSEFKEKKKV